MRIIRLLGSLALWLGALLGSAAGSIWIGAQLGHIQPMIVISGSMEPGIMTGDLLVDRYIPTAQVEIGDVLTLPSEATGKLVTHRVISVGPVDPARAALLEVDLSRGPRWEVRMQGDANGDPDLEAYFPGDRVLTPWVQIPQGGTVVSRVMEPRVAMPVLLALVALLGLSLLDEEPRRVVRRVIHRVRHRDPRIDELDQELEALGVDVERLREMDDLDLQLYALGIDLDLDLDLDLQLYAVGIDLDLDLLANDTDTESDGDPDATNPLRHDGWGFDDGLWDFELPPYDGSDDVRSPDDASHMQPAPLELDQVGRRTPARSG